MLSLSQLISPAPTEYWQQVLLNALQGVGYVTQSSPSGQLQGTGSVTVSGPATQASDVVVLIGTTGNVGTGTFTFSLDGGASYSGSLTIPSGASGNSGSYLITALGVTLTFTNGNYYSPNQTGYFVENETYSFGTMVPTFPVTNWEPEAPSWNLIAADAIALADLDLTATQVTAGGLTQSWITPPPSGAPPSGWLDLLSQNFYNRLRGSGQPTQGIEILTNAGAAAQTITPGELTLQSASGQEFTNLTGGTIAGGGGTLAITVQAVNPGAGYNDIPTYDPNNIVPGGNYLNQIVTPSLPGVSAINGINSSPACIATGSGPASINFTGTASSAFGVIFQINSAGAVGTSTYSYSLDGGNTFTFVGVTASTGVTLNGMTVSFPAGSYAAGATYSFSTAWITQYGSDTQVDLSLATADQNQWTQLAPSSPGGTYKNWALAASPEVTDTFVNQSLTVPGQVVLLLVGQNDGPVSLAAIAAVTSYIIPRLGINDSILVQSVIPITVPITAGSGGTIQIRTSQATSVYAGIAAALFKLQESIPPGGIVRQSDVVAAIVAVPGVVDVIEPLWLNGSLSNIPLLPNEVATLIPPPLSSYTLI